MQNLHLGTINTRLRVNRCDGSLMRWVRGNSPSDQLCAKVGGADLSSALHANHLRRFGLVERASSWINKVRNLSVPGDKVKGGPGIIKCGFYSVNPSGRTGRRWQLDCCYHGGLTPRLTSLSDGSRIIALS